MVAVADGRHGLRRLPVLLLYRFMFLFLVYVLHRISLHYCLFLFFNVTCGLPVADKVQHVEVVHEHVVEDAAAGAQVLLHHSNTAKNYTTTAAAAATTTTTTTTTTITNDTSNSN